MQKRLDPETGVNKICENVFMSGAYSEIFLGRGTNFRHFSSVVFFDRFNLSNLAEVTKTTLGGSGGMLFRKFFKNLRTAMAILVLFEQFLREVCHIFGP